MAFIADTTGEQEAATQLEMTPQVEQAMQQALESLLNQSQAPERKDLEVLSGELRMIIDELTKAFEKGGEQGTKRAYTALLTDKPWLSTLRSKALPSSDSGTEQTADEPRQNKYKPLRISELLAMPDQEWIIENFLYEDSLVVPYGPPGSYKSFLIFGAMAHVALGWKWEGKAVKRCRVIYLAAEGARGYKRRMLAWCSHFNVDLADLEEYMHIIPIAVPLDNVKEVHEYIEAVRKCVYECKDDLPTIIVLDTLFRCSAGMNLNLTEVMTRIVATCETIKIATHAICMIIVHHTGKDEQRGMSGNIALRASTDISFRVTCNDQRVITVTTANGAGKMKDDEDITMYFKWQQVRYGPGPRDHSCIVESIKKPDTPANKVKLTANQHLILDALPDKDGIRYTELLKSTKIAKRTFADNLNKLVDEFKLVLRVGDRYYRAKTDAESVDPDDNGKVE